MGEWAEAVLAIVGVLTCVVSAATAYLRLYVGNRLGQLQQALQRQFVTREIFEARLEPLEHRLSRIEHLEIEGDR